MLGERQGGAEGAHRLAEAVEAFRQALAVRTRDHLPQQWAQTQSNLGGALARLGERQRGAEGVRRLAEAAEAFRQALAVYTRDDLPQQWAQTQNDLGLALRMLGARQGGTRGCGSWWRRSRPSARPSPSAPATTSPSSGPRPRTTWAALARLGERRGGAEGVRQLVEAVEAFRQALAVYTRDHLPQQWAWTRNDLGLALRMLGARQGAPRGAPAGRGGRGLPPGPRRLHSRRPPPAVGPDPEQPGTRARGSGRTAGGRRGAHRLAEAVEAYRQALTVYTRDDLPQQWAQTQNNLGLALRMLGERQGGAEGRTGWPRRSRPSARPSPSTLATTFPSSGPRPRTTWNSHSGCWGGGRGARRLAEAHRQALAVYNRRRLSPAVGHNPEQPRTRAPDSDPPGRFPKRASTGRSSLTRGGHPQRPGRAGAVADAHLVCQVATDEDAEAGRAFASLVALIERQPDDFHLVWDWTPLRKLLTESKVTTLPARRERLKTLIDAVNRDNKAAILAGLEEAQGAFTGRE